MKKTLSLVLALVMILGSFSTVFAATPVTTEAEAGAFLKAAGVLVGDEKGDLNLKDNLLRQDAVILVAQLRGEIKAAQEHKGLPTYEDVKIKFYNAPLAWAQENGLFVGHSDKVFGFGENLTAQEYAKVLLSALGYKVAPNGDSDIKWADALTKAQEFGILENLKVENSTEISRGEMALMTFNALGVNMKGSKETLADKLGIEMPEGPKAKELTAEVLDTENLSEIVVELSNADLVKNKDALTNPANYRINKDDVKVYNVDVDGDKVILTLVPFGKVTDTKAVPTLAKGKEYEVTIRNIDPKINKTYKKVLAGDNAIPVVEKVEFMGDHGIKVTTSEPIANPLERNFRIDSRTAMVVEQYGRELVLTPYHGKAFDKDAKELTIDKLVDFAGYASVKSVEKMELSNDNALPKVEAAYRNGSKLVVEFDRDVYLDSVKHYENRRDLGNVSFVEKRVTSYAQNSKKVNTNVVEYEFAREIPKNIEVEIQGVANHFNKAMEKEVIVPSEFKDDYAPMVISSTAKVKITKAEETKLKSDFPAGTDAEKEALKKALDKGRTVKTQEMTITFDKDIKEFVEYNSKDSKVTKADLVSHFVLYELDITRRGQDAAKAVEINIEDVDVKDVKNDRIKISFDGIKLNNKDRDYDYILEVRDFSDTNRNRMEREYLDFQVVRITSDFNVTMDPAKIRHTDFFNRAGMEIVLEFNDHVNKEEASNARNYYLDGKLDVDEAIVERDGKTVSLVVYDIKDKAALLAKYKVLEISPRVKDLSDPAVSTANRFIELKTGDYKDPTTPVEVSAFTFSDNTGTLTPAQLKGYEVAQNTTSGSAMTMPMTIGYTGSINDVATASLLDKDGKTVAMDRKVLVTTSQALNVNVPLDKATTYTLKVEAEGKVYNLPIRVLGTSTDIVVEYDGVDITAAALSSAGRNLVAGEKFAERKLNIKLADGVAVKDMSKVETAKGIYKVIVTSETGITVVHTVTINEVPLP